MVVTLRHGLSAGVICALTACGSAESISLRNPDYFLVRVSEGTLTGSYNPAGYNRSVVQNQIKGACASDTLASYGEAPADDGLLAFTAVCEGPSVFNSGVIEIERVAENRFTFEALGS